MPWDRVGTFGAVQECQRRFSITLLFSVVSALLGGCGVTAPERLECTSMGDTPRTLSVADGRTTYSLELANTEFLHSSLAPEQFDESPIPDGYILHAELMWVPKAGKTAVDPQATNVSLRLVVISGGELGLYGGGGFAWPQGEPGAQQHGLDLVGSNLTLLAATAGFVDLLSPSQITGRITASLDPELTRQVRRAASQAVTNALKRVQWVGPPAKAHFR
jgi:hypothetical protein